MNGDQKFLAVITRLNLDQIEQEVIDGRRLYKVSDLCGQLQITNTSVAMNNVSRDHKVKLPVTAVNVGGVDVTVKAWFVSEAGVYQLIMHNKTDATKRIRDRIASELLPNVEIDD